MKGAQRLAPRGGPVTTALAHELGLHCYPWPNLLGEDRSKWEQLAEFIDRAALHDHKRECTGSPTGRGGHHAQPYNGDHARHHQTWAEIHLVAFVEAGGFPVFLVKDDDDPRIGQDFDFGQEVPDA